jgi:hypothetical protein
VSVSGRSSAEDRRQQLIAYTPEVSPFITHSPRPAPALCVYVCVVE